MKKLYEEHGLSFYLYKPTLTKPFYLNLEPLTLRRRIRLISAYFSGFKVYYLRLNNEYVGYCLVQNGRDSRYKFATKKDIIVGPYFIREDQRGKKFSIYLLNYILKKSNIDYESAYDYIHKDNIASIKATEAAGFKLFSSAKITKFLRGIHLMENQDGDYLIFKFSKK